MQSCRCPGSLLEVGGDDLPLSCARKGDHKQRSCSRCPTCGVASASRKAVIAVWFWGRCVHLCGLGLIVQLYLGQQYPHGASLCLAPSPSSTCCHGIIESNHRVINVGEDFSEHHVQLLSHPHPATKPHPCATKPRPHAMCTQPRSRALCCPLERSDLALPHSAGDV